MRYWLLFLVTFLTVSSDICFNILDPVRSTLQKNIQKLLDGKLKFTDSFLPTYKNELADTTPENHSEYDFIVIGAGSAGATIASRLSETKDATVLLIEAGSKEYPIMDIPAFAIPLQLSKEINWAYETEPSDKYCQGVKGTRCRWARGKVSGGSSTINFMVATRGNKEDYNEWARLSGDDSWSYKEMLHYLKKLENFDVKGVKVDNALHNTSGPVHVTGLARHSILGDAFIEAGKELGYPEIDYNGHEQIGFSYFQTTIVNGERWSTNRAYLHPAKGRKNLHLSRNSYVNKILINEETKTAYGVQFSKNSKIIEVKAKKEVILSAGAINSPQILMLSGIGPAQHLQDLGINVIKDAPVGENLMDHIAYGGLSFKANTSLDSNQMNPKNMVENLLSKDHGILSGVGFEGLSYVNVDDPTALKGIPNLEIIFGSTGGIMDPMFSKVVGVTDSYRTKMLANLVNTGIWTLWPMITSPKSRGKMLLKSADPKDKPKLYANYLEDPDDVRVLIKGIRMCLKLSQTNAFKKHGSELYSVPLPCENHEYDSDAYWECALRTYTFTIYHQSGTCKMGRQDDTTSVVNSKLQVIGVKGLRVADASIMPVIVNGHPNIPIIAIAEKAADMIKRDYTKH